MSRRRVAVVGGSLAGMMAAAALSRTGFEVDVYERSGESLRNFGAGIRLQPVLAQWLAKLDRSRAERATTTRRLRLLDGDGEVEHDLPELGTFTGWNNLHAALSEATDPARVHWGHGLSGFEADAHGVTLRFADGLEARVDLALFADGIASTGRRRLWPDLDLNYAGYVAWRGVVAEHDLAPAAVEAFADATTVAYLFGHHIAVYPIPGPDGDTAPGRRRFNFIWYRNVEAGPALEELMTNRDGYPSPLSLRPGAVQGRFVEELHEAAGKLGNTWFREIVRTVAEPLIQPIYDLDVPAMAVGRVGLLGDAAVVARPHAGAATTKAAIDALLLAESLRRCGGDIDAALAAWEPGQLELGRGVLARSRAIGALVQSGETFDRRDARLKHGLADGESEGEKRAREVVEAL